MTFVSLNVLPAHRQPVCLIALVSLLFFVCFDAFVQAFLSRSLRWIVPIAPDGGTDLPTRIVAETFGELLRGDLRRWRKCAAQSKIKPN